MGDCNHIVGIHHDYADTDIVMESEIVTGKQTAENFWKKHVNQISFFSFCPDCGEKLDTKEKYGG